MTDAIQTEETLKADNAALRDLLKEVRDWLVRDWDADQRELLPIISRIDTVLNKNRSGH